MSKYYSIPPQLYDDQFWWKKDDIEFWKSTLVTSHTRTTILELASSQLPWVNWLEKIIKPYPITEPGLLGFNFPPTQSQLVG